MLKEEKPAHLVEEMPDDPSGTWDQSRWPLAAWTTADKWTYVKDLIHRHRGEVREIYGEWQLVHEPFPEGENFHHAQFSLTYGGSKVLTTFTGKAGRRGGRKGKGGKGDDGRWRQGKNQEKGNDDGRWRQEGWNNWDNTMVRAVGHDDAKHWKREAWCCGLAEVFARFGDRYTTKQLYQYYLAATILVHKRVHGKSAPERVEAAQRRHRATGRWGFPAAPA